MTPDAPQGAPFKEHGRPYTVAVMDRVTLDIKYIRILHNEDLREYI
jgi:hypothetical protein